MLKFNFAKGEEVPESTISTVLKCVSIGSGVAFGGFCIRDYMRYKNSSDTKGVSPEAMEAASDLPDRLLAEEDV